MSVLEDVNLSLQTAPSASIYSLVFLKLPSPTPDAVQGSRVAVESIILESRSINHRVFNRI